MITAPDILFYRNNSVMFLSDVRAIRVIDNPIYSQGQEIRKIELQISFAGGGWTTLLEAKANQNTIDAEMEQMNKHKDFLIERWNYYKKSLKS